MKRIFVLACGVVLAVASASGAVPAPSDSAPVATQAVAATADDNDGTDPTKPTSQIKASIDRQNFPGDFATNFLSLEYNRPLGDGSWVVRPKVQFGSLSGAGVDTGLDVGDASIKLTKIVERTSKHGIVATFEVLAPTGSANLTGGKWLVKPNLIYAMFLKGGHIFAPAIVHVASIGGDASKPPINITTLDFYFVPRLANKNLFMTIDPAVNFDWEGNREFGALAVTFGYKLGPMLGGRGQISVKPLVLVGHNAPSDWGVQLAFQLLGL